MAFVACAIGAMVAIEALQLPAAARAGVAALPVAAFAWFIVAEMRSIRCLDELRQRIQLEALAIAYPSAILLVFGLGFLERAGVRIPAFEQLRDVWPLTTLPYFVGLYIAQRRYR